MRPPAPHPLLEVRERVARGMLYVLLAIGGLAVVGGILNAFLNGDPAAWLLTGAYLLAWTVLAVAALVPRLPLQLRTGTIVLTFFGIGALLLLLGGLQGEGRLFLLAGVGLTALLRSRRGTLVAAASAPVLFAAIGVLRIASGDAVLGQFPTDPELDDLTSWSVATVIFLLLTAVLALPTQLVMRALERSLAEADRTAARFHTLYDELPSVYLSILPDLTIVRLNAWGAAKLGRRPAEVVGLSVLDLLAPEERPSAQAHLEGLLGGDISASESTQLTFEARVPTHRGDRIIAFTPRSVPDLDGTATLLLCGVDVTARRDLEARFLQAQKMEVFGQLAGGVAHDFNNLLQPIVSGTELALSGLPADSPQRPVLEEVADTADRAASLTRQILGFSRQQPVQLERVGLDEVLASSEDLARRLVTGERVRLRSDLQSPTAEVWADAHQIGQIVMNLVVNARDAMPEGGDITLRSRRLDDSRVCIEVQDQGIGMDADTAARIFEPFFTTKPPGKGTGLGLATVASLVEQHRGEVEVYSAPGEGTTFRIVLPGIEEEPGEDDPDSLTHPSVPTAGAGITVLLVDDEPGLRRMVGRILTGAGLEIVSTGSAEEALTLAGELQVDLLVTDVVLPGRSGPELYGELRAERPELPVVFLTGYARVPEALQQHPVVHKPFSRDALLRAVDGALHAVRGD